MSRLTCSEFDELLFEQTTVRGDDEPLTAHAAACSRCAAVWAEERALDAAIDAWKTGVPEAELAGRVLAGWRDERATVSPQDARPATRRQHSTGRRHFALLAVTAAAGVVLAVSLILQNARRPAQDIARTTPDTHRASVPEKKQQHSPRPDVEELPVDQLVAGMRTRYSGAARRITKLADGWKLPWPAVADVDVELLPQRTVPRAKRSPQDTDGGLEALKPIGRDVGKAFSFLRDAVPGLDDDSRI